MAAVMALLVLCPCGPMMFGGQTGDAGAAEAHACCAPREGISADTGGCCSDEATGVDATAAVPPPSLAGPQAAPVLHAALPTLSQGLSHSAPRPSTAAPPILRI